MTPTPRPSQSLRLDEGPIDGDFWPGVAAGVSSWLQQREVLPRDAVVLLPFAALLAPAREAFARRGGWQPRVETMRTWSAALAPALPAAARQVSGDTVTDRASAAALLRTQAAGADWARRDRAGFDAAVISFVDTAQALLRAAHERPISERDAWWAAWREGLSPGGGPGSTERWLARIAVEWAAAADAPAWDRLWDERPAAWIALTAGGADAGVDALLGAAARRGDPVLRLEADPPLSSPFDASAPLPPPRRWLGEGLEAEAQAATLAVLDALAAGRSPVALIAQDRVVVRRVRALLERAGVALRDETGWTLSTTRSAARLMAWLRAARPDAGRDELLDALKVEHAGSTALARLEAGWRRGPVSDASSQAWCDATLAPLREWARAGARPLASWLAGLPLVLPGTVQRLAEDDAGRALLSALQLDGSPASPAWEAAAAANTVDLAGFVDWVDATLESANFVPPTPPSFEVVITPLARAMLRPFGAVVMPGCDHQRLGAASPSPGLLPEALMRSQGLPDGEERRQRERLAFAQILRAPDLSLLRRRSDQGEPLAASLLVEHAWQSRRRLGQPAPDECEAPLPQRLVQTRVRPRPLPQAPSSLPPRLSASAVEQLRDCPYRFFARTLLGLHEAVELDAELEKRDYGTWLHGVLLRFHAARAPDAPADRIADRERLAAAALEEQAALGLDAAQLLPYRAAFDVFCAHYLAWLHEREAAGWRYEAGEIALRREDPALGGLALEGRIDRVDRHAASGARQLIDYKTGNPQGLRDKVADPSEDTQLAFYAALLAADGSSASGPAPQPVRAIYLALDERKPPQPIEHPDVADSAEQLVAHLAQELDRVRAGARLPALGEGAVCEHCEVRGLCRRDDWPAAE